MKKLWKLLVGALVVAGCVLSLSGCDNPGSVGDFALDDSKGKQIDCAALVSMNTDQGKASFESDDAILPVVLREQREGYVFHQCSKEIEADRQVRCKHYASAVAEALARQGDPNFPGFTQLDDWAGVCSAEIRSAVADVSDEFKIDLGGPNPLVDLHRAGLALPMSSIQTLSIDQRYSGAGLWQVHFVTSSGKYTLWYGSNKKATAAYDELRSAWRLAAPVPADRKA
jgi:hypothetical protein